ncbi:MAG: hypothetical protein AAB433_18805 [Nitrospirota bacterium]
MLDHNLLCDDRIYCFADRG